MAVDTPQDSTLQENPRRSPWRIAIVLLPLVLLTAAIALLWLSRSHQADRDRRAILALPFSGGLHPQPNGDIRADKHSYSLEGRYKIVDIADVRVVLPGSAGRKWHTSADSRSVTVGVSHGSSQTGVIVVKSAANETWPGPVRAGGGSPGDMVEDDLVNGQATVYVNDVPIFTIKDCVLRAGTAEVKIGGGPKVVFLRKDGTVESIEAIKP